MEIYTVPTDVSLNFLKLFYNSLLNLLAKTQLYNKCSKFDYIFLIQKRTCSKRFHLKLVKIFIVICYGNNTLDNSF